MASFGKRFGKKKLFKIKEMPRMAHMARQNGAGGGFGKQEKKKESVTEM